MRTLPGYLRVATLVTFAVLVGSCASVDPGNVSYSDPATLQTTSVQTAEVQTTGATSSRRSNAPYKGEDAIFAFQPMSGAPSEMIFMLEDLIAAEAKVRKLNLVPANDPTANYIVRGRISAVGDTHNVVMVYVWDVYDRAGQRLKRISGQEIAGGSGNDPWAAVEPDTMRFAAQDTVDTLAAWIRP